MEDRTVGGQMKAVLEFNLDDLQDREEHEAAIQGSRLRCVLWDLDQKLRETWKYGDDEKLAEYAQSIREHMTYLMDKYKVSMD